MKLTNDNIARAVEDIQKFFEQADVSERDRLKINLTVEEALLRCQENFGAEKSFELKTRKLFGAPKVLIRIRGKAYNPLETPEDYDDEVITAKVMQNLLNYETAGTSYRYQNGCNEISIFSTKERKPLKIPGGNITVAILLAFAASFAVGQLPQFVQDFIVQKLTVPLLKTLMGLIVAVTIPTIFVSVMSSICIMDDIATLNDIGFKVIRRFVVNMLIIIIGSICSCALFFPVITIEGNANVFVEQVIEMLLGAVPNDLFKPFVEGNVLQIVMIAFLFGVGIVILDKRTANMKNLVNESKILLLRIMELVLKVIPLTIFLSIFKTVMTTSFTEFVNVWKLVAASYITYIGIGLIMLAHLKLKYKLDIADFFRKNAPVFIITTTTASGSISMMKNFDVCKKNMKIDPNLCDFWIPLSHTLFSPGTVNTLVTCAFMGASMSNATISLSQLLIIAFLAIQLAIVTPKVYGGNIATFTILLTHLGFTQDAIGPMMVADVFTINLAALFGIVMRNCEIYDLSHQVKFSAA